MPCRFKLTAVALAHLVLRRAGDLPVHVLGLELVGELDVEVAVVLLAGPRVEDTGDVLALLDSEHVLEVEDGLFPVRVLCVRARGELDGLVARGELNVEPRNDGVDEVAAAHLEAKGAVEGQVGDGASVEVEGQDGRGVGDDGLDVDGVDEGLSHGGGLERRVVEAPDVIPD
jgi:hypothetical protein